MKEDIEILADGFHFHSDLHWSLNWIISMSCEVCRYHWKRKIIRFIKGR